MEGYDYNSRPRTWRHETGRGNLIMRCVYVMGLAMLALVVFFALFQIVS